MKKRRVALGGPLPPVADVSAPTEQYLAQLSAKWDALVPDYAGMLDPEPSGSEIKAAFYWDEKTQTMTRADGTIVTLKERIAAHEIWLKAMLK